MIRQDNIYTLILSLQVLSEKPKDGDPGRAGFIGKARFGLYSHTAQYT